MACEVECRENGADFYGLPRNEGFVELKEGVWRLAREEVLSRSGPEIYTFGDSVVIPLRAGETLKWKAERCE